MWIKRFDECPEFTAGDGSILREFLHPDKADLQLRYSLAHAVVAPGQMTTPHCLETSEVYYIIQGWGCMHIEQESAEVGPGCTVYIPPDAVQCIENIGDEDLKFLCIVDPAWRPEDEQILDESI
ncbi:MAG: cupin domain-containing protein [Deltaproteobacteria bacterium]|jgi:mannose-6-phosphate isomerase-like protein (cupin superfamily)|nr:cupin domain-containing protein [Deltaproteobacteria bacterium]